MINKTKGWENPFQIAKLGEEPPPGGGGGLDASHALQSQVRPGQTFAGAAQAAGGTVPGGRSWLQIFNDAKQKRNILEIHISKIDDQPNDENREQRPKGLTNDQLSDFLFNILKINEDDCTGLDYFYGHKEIELKEGVDITSFLHVDIPIKYLDYNIIVKKQETNFATKILFRNVPLNVPEEELMNLALCYGQPVGSVKRERLFNQKDRGKFGANRSLDVLLNPGQAFENYFWLEGPLPSDQGRRITVTHQNQPQQCSNCFGYSTNKYGSQLGLCPGNGNGRACKEMNTERAKMGPYMKALERLLGYRSIKSKFSRMGPMNEPVIDEEDTEITFNTTYKSPIIEKNEQIQTLLNEQETLRLEHEKLRKELPILQENLTKTTSKLSAVQKKVHQKSKQIHQASSITEKRLAEAISLEPAYLRDNPHLVTLLAVLQERDDFDVDTDTEVVKPVHEETFMKETIKNVMELTTKNSELLPIQADQCQERLGDVKTQLLESVKKIWIRSGSRRNSICSESSVYSKRDRDEELSSERSNRPRTSLTPP